VSEVCKVVEVVLRADEFSKEFMMIEFLGSDTM
jgi:hypothetical protein